MEGDIRLTLEREPDFFAAADVEGDFHQTLVARDTRTGRVIALGTRSIRDAYVNGRPARLGYLGQLRIHPDFRRRDTILGGYAFLRELHADGRVPFYVTSILSENRPARRLLEANLPGMPTYRPLEEFQTFVLPTPRYAPPHAGLGAESDDPDSSSVPRFLDEQNYRFQFAPNRSHHGRANLSRAFIVQRRGDAITATAAVWDQRAIKQTVVRSYPPKLRRLRPLVNLLSPITGWPKLPRVNRPLQQAYLSHLAVENDDPSAFDELLAAALAAARSKGCDYLVAGLAARHPLAPVLRQRKHRLVRSTLYAVHWPEGRPAVEALDGRIPHVEVATL